MEWKWYWFAEGLGLVERMNNQFGEQWQISAKTDEVFFWLGVGLFVFWFLLGCVATVVAIRKEREALWNKVSRVIVGCFLIYGICLAVGIGPYIKWYPQGSGFIDFTLLEHMINAVRMVLLAGCFLLGKRIGRKLSKKPMGEVDSHRGI